MTIIAVVFAGGLLIWLPMFLFGDNALLPSLMGYFVGLLGAGLLFRCRQALMIRSFHKAQCEDPRSEWAFRDVRVVLSSNQLRRVARGATCVYEWSRVWHIDETDKLVSLWVTRDSAIIIPRRAFRDDRHFEEFIALARQYQQERGQRAPKPIGIITALPPQSDAFTLPGAP